MICSVDILHIARCERGLPLSCAGSSTTCHLTDPRHFSRHRVLDFVLLICWFLSRARPCVQTELDRLFAVLRDQAELARTVSAQTSAFARPKVCLIMHL